MNRKDYLYELESRSAYCLCEGVLPLKKKAERIEQLALDCASLKESVNLRNPSQEDELSLRDYLAKRDLLERVMGEYNELIADGLISRTLHRERMKLGFSLIKCSNCHQQVEVCEEH